LPSAVPVEGEGVDHERVAQDLRLLAELALGVSTAEVQGVIQGSVDGLSVVAPGVQTGEVWTCGFVR
jgi:hypothetical protein